MRWIIAALIIVVPVIIIVFAILTWAIQSLANF
jgi:hypothetical protein